ncbi:DUF3397 domain-containing protein [Alkalicoccus chagannorensis]|uniref:DUF3397 domain-containing protein n=1 Tax=Alkalicoccus chagannorensis TaxID=427072 RepID=UPI00041AA09B|nr:DUF3397 domain-containing protein [Alkalicoccus chagannorensis]
MGEVDLLFLAAASLMPAVVFVLVYVVLKKLRVSKNRAMQVSADVTVPFLIAATLLIGGHIWQTGSVGWAVLLYTATLILFLLLHWKTAEEVQMWKAVRQAWRFQFLIYALLVAGLAVVGFFWA